MLVLWRKQKGSQRPKLPRPCKNPGICKGGLNIASRKLSSRGATHMQPCCKYCMVLIFVLVGCAPVQLYQWDICCLIPIIFWWVFAIFTLQWSDPATWNHDGGTHELLLEKKRREERERQDRGRGRRETKGHSCVTSFFSSRAVLSSHDINKAKFFGRIFCWSYNLFCFTGLVTTRLFCCHASRYIPSFPMYSFFYSPCYIWRWL